MKQNEPLDILVDFDETFRLQLDNKDVFGKIISDRYLIITALNNYQPAGKSINWLTNSFRNADKEISLNIEECEIIENALSKLYTQHSVYYSNNWSRWRTNEQEQWKYQIDRIVELRNEIFHKRRA